MKSYKSKKITKYKSKSKSKKTKLNRNTRTKTNRTKKNGGGWKWLNKLRGRPPKLATLRTEGSHEASNIPNYLGKAFKAKKEDEKRIVGAPGTWAHNIHEENLGTRFLLPGRVVHNPLYKNGGENTVSPAMENFLLKRNMDPNIKYHDIRNSSGVLHQNVASFNNFTRDLLKGGPKTVGKATSRAVIVSSPQGPLALTETAFGG